jgi:hypothetical protein
MTTESRQDINTKSNEVTLKELLTRLHEWWRYLISKWVIILISSLICSGLGFFYAYSQKPFYTASTTFVLEDEQPSGMGNLAGLASMAGLDLGGGGGGIFQGENIFELYKSRKMLLQTLLTEIPINGKKQALVDRYIEFKELRKSWANDPKLVKMQFSSQKHEVHSYLEPNRLRDSVLSIIIKDIVRDYLTVGKPDKKLNIIKIDVKAEDENFAKGFNEQLVKNVNDFYLLTKTKRSLQNVQIIQRKTDSVTSLMNGAIYEAAAVSDATPNLNPSRQSQRVAPAQKAQFSAETNKAILSALVQNLEMSKVALMKETPLLEVIDQPVFPLAKEKFGKALGMIIGGLSGGLMICMFLIVRRFLKLIMA